MKAYLLSVVVVLAAVLTGLLTGCEDNAFSKSPEGPDIGGSWNGTYERPGLSEPLSAKITQDGDSVVIETTLSGPGELFTGAITKAGDIEAMDNYNGKTWTSLGETTPKHVYIRDYLNVGASEAVQAINLIR